MVYLLHLASCMLASPGNKVFEVLDYRLYKWPGHGTPPDTPYQCVEGEYMHEDEYDALIQDPSAYWMRFYLPRVFGALEPWGLLGTLHRCGGDAVHKSLHEPMPTCPAAG